MAYTAKEIIDDVLARVDIEDGKISRLWLLHLLNMAQVDFAKRTHRWRKEEKIEIDTQYNAFMLPTDFLELKNAKYAQDGVTYYQLSPMDLGERQTFEKQIVVG